MWYEVEQAGLTPAAVMTKPSGRMHVKGVRGSMIRKPAGPVAADVSREPTLSEIMTQTLDGVGTVHRPKAPGMKPVHPKVPGANPVHPMSSGKHLGFARKPGFAAVPGVRPAVPVKAGAARPTVRHARLGGYEPSLSEIMDQAIDGKPIAPRPTVAAPAAVAGPVTPEQEKAQLLRTYSFHGGHGQKRAMIMYGQGYGLGGADTPEVTLSDETLAGLSDYDDDGLGKFSLKKIVKKVAAPLKKVTAAVATGGISLIAPKKVVAKIEAVAKKAVAPATLKKVLGAVTTGGISLIAPKKVVAKIEKKVVQTAKAAAKPGQILKAIVNPIALLIPKKTEAKLKNKIVAGAKLAVKSPGKFVAKTLAQSTVGLLSKSAGKKFQEKLITQARVSRGAIGFKKGLTKKELKMAKTAMIVGAAIVAVAATVVTLGAAGPLIGGLFGGGGAAGAAGAGGAAAAAAGAGGAAAGGGLWGTVSAIVGLGGSAASLVGKVKSARKAAGLSPITSEAVLEAASNEQRDNPSLSSEEALQVAAARCETAEVSPEVAAAGAQEDIQDPGGANYINSTFAGAAQITEDAARAADAEVARAEAAGEFEPETAPAAGAPAAAAPVSSGTITGGITEAPAAWGGTEAPAEEVTESGGEMAAEARPVFKMSPMLLAGAGLLVAVGAGAAMLSKRRK